MTDPAVKPKPEQPIITVAVLKPSTVAMWRRPIVGEGGWQTLFRRIQAGLDGSVLTAATADLDELVRMVSGGKGKHLGGYQYRAKALVVDVCTWQVFRRPPRLRLLAFHRPPAPPPVPEQQPLTLEED